MICPGCGAPLSLRRYFDGMVHRWCPDCGWWDVYVEHPVPERRHRRVGERLGRAVWITIWRLMKGPGGA